MGRRKLICMPLTDTIAIVCVIITSLQTVSTLELKRITESHCSPEIDSDLRKGNDDHPCSGAHQHYGPSVNMFSSLITPSLINDPKK